MKLFFLKKSFCEADVITTRPRAHIHLIVLVMFKNISFIIKTGDFMKKMFILFALVATLVLMSGCCCLTADGYDNYDYDDWDSDDYYYDYEGIVPEMDTTVTTN